MNLNFKLNLNFIGHIFLSRSMFQMLAIFLELNSKRLNRMQDKKKKIVVLCSRPPQNVKLQLSSDCKEMYIEA